MGNFIKAGSIFAMAALWMITGLFAPDDDVEHAEEPSYGPAVVTYVNVQQQQLQRTVVAAGQTQPDKQVQVLSRARGYADYIAHSLEGAFVKKGTLLCRLQDEGQQAGLLDTQAQLEIAQTNLSAIEGLRVGRLSSPVELANARGARDRARAALLRAEVQVANQQIVAPFDGIVHKLNLEVGQAVLADKPCANMISVDPILVVAEIPEKEIHLFDMGSRAEISLSSGEIGYGEVRYIASQANSGTRTFTVELAIPNPSHSVRAGLTADVKIFGLQQFAHEIPYSALALSEESQLVVKLIDEEQRVQEVGVEILEQSGDNIWIQGLPERASLITRGQYYYNQGEEVQGQLADEASKG